MRFATKRWMQPPYTNLNTRRNVANLRWQSRASNDIGCRRTWLACQLRQRTRWWPLHYSKQSWQQNVIVFKLFPQMLDDVHDFQANKWKLHKQRLDHKISIALRPNLVASINPVPRGGLFIRNLNDMHGWPWIKTPYMGEFIVKKKCICSNNMLFECTR
jgi:hypothetical protein